MRIVIISGYFNPPHAGHIDYIIGARKLLEEGGLKEQGELWVIVNNDHQHTLKKGPGKKVCNEQDRMYVVQNIKGVDQVFLSIDEDLSQCATLEWIATKYPGNQYIFANGGDRHQGNIPETGVCKKYGIKMVDGVGGTTKRDSSTRINQALGLKP